MGRNSFQICDTCRTWQYNGYGSYGSWLDSYLSVEAFDGAAKTEDDLGCTVACLDKNINVRDFLERHRGHQIRFTSTDWDFEAASEIFDPEYREPEGFFGGSLPGRQPIPYTEEDAPRPQERLNGN